MTNANERRSFKIVYRQSEVWNCVIAFFRSLCWFFFSYWNATKIRNIHIRIECKILLKMHDHAWFQWFIENIDVQFRHVHAVGQPDQAMLYFQNCQNTTDILQMFRAWIRFNGKIRRLWQNATDLNSIAMNQLQRKYSMRLGASHVRIKIC